MVSDAGIDLFSTADPDPQVVEVPREPGRYIVTAWVPPNLLAEGSHYLRVVMRSMKEKYRPFTERDVVAITVVDPSGGFATSWWEGKPSGVIRPVLDWHTEYVSADMVIEGLNCRNR